MRNQSAHRKSPPTVADVAATAGVAKATAARALGKYGKVSKEVREKVAAAAEKLGYRPNDLARSMTTGRSSTIGILVGDIENPYFSMAVRGIADAVRDAGFSVVVTNSAEEIDAERDAIQTLLAKRVDGIIVSPAHCRDFAHLEGATQAGVPIVLMDRAVPELKTDTVTANDRAAAMEATRRLIHEGHRKIAYVTACDAPREGTFWETGVRTASVRERIDGFLTVCRDAGIDKPENNVTLGAKTHEGTCEMVRQLLTSPTPPTAILASDSKIGLGVFEVVRDLGLSIPQDVSMISFHNADWTRVTQPPITVIDQPVYQLGSKAAQLMLDRLNENTDAPHVIELTSKLIERGSVGPVPQKT